MIRRLVLLGAALLLGGAAVPAATPVSRMDLPWWRARFAAKQQELAHADPQLIWLGDSITQDWEKTGPEPWRDFRPVWDRYYAPRHAINLGFKGDATAHLLWRIEHGETDGIRPRVAIVLIGANNFGHLHWPAAPTQAGIEAIVAALHRRLPETRIVLLGVLPSRRSAWVDQNTQALNRSLARRFQGDRQVAFVDVGRLLERGGRADPDKFLDGHLTPPDPPLHPSAQAQATLALAIEPVVNRLMQGP